MTMAGAPDLELDHIVIAARSLEQGAEYVRDRLGVDIPAGGKHPLMGTHNCLMRLGATAFLEVIAIDPAAEQPGRPRWYGLDEPRLQERIGKRPQLITWVMRSRNIERDALTAGYAADEIIPVSRGTLSWRLTVPANGTLPWGGAFPHLIEWDGGVRPWEQMADRNVQLLRLRIGHPEADRLVSMLAKLTGTIPPYAAIADTPEPTLTADLEIDGRVVTL